MKTLAVIVVLTALLSVCYAKDEAQVADLVKKNLNSIGTEQARASVKSRATEGTITFKIPNSNTGNQDGKEVYVSEGNKLVSLLKLPNPSYHGERFVSDGKKTFVTMLRPGVYSSLGTFVSVHNEILTEGLWGGELSTSWALAHLEERLAKVQDRGLKKVDGRELHRVDYLPKKHSDLEIQLYFEPDTLRHVMTVYSLTIAPQIGRTEADTARQQESRYRLEERFSDFKAFDNLTLPTRWSIQYTAEDATTGAAGGSDLPSGRGGGIDPALNTNGIGSGISPVIQYDVTVTNVSHNVTLDPKNFEVK
jgi:outer membrane lipoprotein-sorting protein